MRMLLARSMGIAAAFAAIACGGAGEEDLGAIEAADAESALIDHLISDNKNVTWCNEAFLNHQQYWDDSGVRSPASVFYVDYLKKTFAEETGFTFTPVQCSCTEQPVQVGGGTPKPLRCTYDGGRKVADIHLRDTQRVQFGVGRTTNYLEVPAPPSGLRRIRGADIDIDMVQVESMARLFGVTVFEAHKYILCHEIGNAFGLEDTPGSQSCLNNQPTSASHLRNFAEYSSTELSELRTRTGTGAEL